MEISNYEITKKRVEGEFKKYDHEMIAKKLDLTLDDEYVYTFFFSRKYRIHRESGLVERFPSESSSSGNGTDSAFSEANFEEVLTIFDILCDSKPGASPSGEYTLLHQLAKVQNASSYAGAGAFIRDSEFFDNNPSVLRSGCIALGGEAFGKGDISYRIPAFKDLCVVVSFWHSDEDFPPQLQIMCDTNTLNYMHYETTWYMAGHLVGLLKQVGEK